MTARDTRQTGLQWLRWAREMQALAQTGLTFTQDRYDHKCYERLRILAAEMIAQQASQREASKPCWPDRPARLF